MAVYPCVWEVFVWESISSLLELRAKRFACSLVPSCTGVGVSKTWLQLSLVLFKFRAWSVIGCIRVETTVTTLLVQHIILPKPVRSLSLVDGLYRYSLLGFQCHCCTSKLLEGIRNRTIQVTQVAVITYTMIIRPHMSSCCAHNTVASGIPLQTVDTRADNKKCLGTCMVLINNVLGYEANARNN